MAVSCIYREIWDHTIIRVQRDLRRSPLQPPAKSRGSSEAKVPWCFVRLGLFSLQRWRLHRLHSSRQPVPALCCPHSEKDFPIWTFALRLFFLRWVKVTNRCFWVFQECICNLDLLLSWALLGVPLCPYLYFEAWKGIWKSYLMSPGVHSFKNLQDWNWIIFLSKIITFLCFMGMI